MAFFRKIENRKPKIENCLWLHPSAILWLALLAGATGCQNPPAPPKPHPTLSPVGRGQGEGATQQPAVPKLPEQIAKTEDETPTGMDLLVVNPASPRHKDQGYRQDEFSKCPVGRLVGVVRFAGPAIRRERVPPPRKLDTPEALGIPDPGKRPGEVEYFLNTKLTENRYLHHDFVQPIEAVIILREIKSSKRAMLNRPTFLIRAGEFRPHIQFSPPHERVMFGTYDAFATDVRIRSLATAKQVMDAEVSSYDPKDIRQLGGGGVELKVPQMTQSPVIHELGGYGLGSRRHPWKRAYFFVVDNPYALVVNGDFTIGDVPVGTWKVDIWHPLFKPVKASCQVEIKEDTTTEIAVEFEPPDYLKAETSGKKN